MTLAEIEQEYSSFMKLESVVAASIERVYYGKLYIGKEGLNESLSDQETFECPVK